MVKRGYFVLLLVSLALIILLANVKASTPGNISSCQTLDTPGAYTLNQSVTGISEDCFTITSDNVTLDGNGFSIVGNVQGISAPAKVINFTVKNFGGINVSSTGINLVSVENSSVINNKINCLNSGLEGIYLNIGPENDLVSNNTVIFCGHDGGIAIYLGVNNTVSNNLLVNNDATAGIQLLSSSNNTISNNLLINNSGAGIKLFSSSNNLLINNNANSNNYGIYLLEGSSNNTILNSLIDQSLQNDIVIDQFSTNSLNDKVVNSTYNSSSEFVGSGAQLIREWYYSANVTNSAGNPVNLANVTGFNESGIYQFNVTTNTGGLTPLQTYIQYVNNGGTITYYSNYTIFASDAFHSVNHSLNLTGNVLNDIFTFPDTAPIIQNLSSSYLACEGQSLNVHFNVTNNDFDQLTPSINDSSLFLFSPNPISPFVGITDVRLFSDILNKTRIGKHVETVKVSDGQLSDKKDINITVIEINNPPVLTLSNQTVTAGNSFNYQVGASDVESGDQNSGNLTFNMTFLSGTQFFNMTTNNGSINAGTSSGNVGSYLIGVCVTDKNLSVIDQNISLCGQTGLNTTVCGNFTLTVNSASNGNNNGGGGGGGGATISGSGGFFNSSNTENVTGFVNTTLVNICVPSYSCSDWNSCVNGSEQRICKDSKCNNGPITQVRPCSTNPNCKVNFQCTGWGQCNYLGKINDIFNGEIRFTGFQQRYCQDLNKCVSDYTEEQFCSNSNKVNFVKKQECGIQYVYGYVNGSIVTKIGFDGPNDKLYLNFVQSNTLSCDTCRDGIKNGDETGLDCGGSCKPCSLDKPSFLDKIADLLRS